MEISFKVKYTLTIKPSTPTEIYSEEMKTYAHKDEYILDESIDMKI